MRKRDCYFHYDVPFWEVYKPHITDTNYFGILLAVTIRQNVEVSKSKTSSWLDFFSPIYFRLLFMAKLNLDVKSGFLRTKS